MSKSLYIYTHKMIKELEKLVEDFQEEFDILLGDTFSDDELLEFEKYTDSLASIEVGPILSELTFDDLNADPSLEDKQRDFFSKCRSLIVLDNLPYLETNPFQVTYLKDLLWSFEEVLIDRAGMNELQFRDDYLQTLKGLKTIDSMVIQERPAPKKQIVLEPIDLLIRDVYQELRRVGEVSGEDLSEKTQKLLKAMKTPELDSSEIFRLSGLNPKDFDDHLEKLKFYLRRIGSV